MTTVRLQTISRNYTDRNGWRIVQLSTKRSKSRVHCWFPNAMVSLGRVDILGIPASGLQFDLNPNGNKRAVRILKLAILQARPFRDRRSRLICLPARERIIIGPELVVVHPLVTIRYRNQQRKKKVPRDLAPLKKRYEQQRELHLKTYLD